MAPWQCRDFSPNFAFVHYIMSNIVPKMLVKNNGIVDKFCGKVALLRSIYIIYTSLMEVVNFRSQS